MKELTLTTPALLFSAISLIMLAYTNRFLAYAAIIRNLKDRYLKRPELSIMRQINNLRLRIKLTRYMQISGILSLILCVGTMFLIYVGFKSFAVWVFGIGLLLLIISLIFLIWEIQISAKALQHHLVDIVSDMNKVD